MAFMNFKRTESRGAHGVIRTHVEHSLVKSQEDIRRERKTERLEEGLSTMKAGKKMVAGIPVSDALYTKYHGRRFVVGNTDIPFETIELLSKAADVATADPELQQNCLEVVERVKGEITAMQLAEKGMLFEPHHESFSGYLDDLKVLHDAAAAERAQLMRAHQENSEHWQAIENDKSKSELERIKARANRLEADEDYKKAVEDLQDRTRESIETVRENFEEHLQEFYSPSGSKIDQETVTLLQSGIVLKEKEVSDLFDKYFSNPTMIRLLYDYSKQHNMEPKHSTLLFSRATSNGEHETRTFDTVAELIRRAVGEKEYDVVAWGNDKGNFENLYDQAVQSIEGVLVKPEVNDYEKQRTGDEQAKDR